MQKPELISELKVLRTEIEQQELRSDLTSRRTILGRISALLNFNSMLHTNAVQAASILSEPNFSSGLYERMEARLDYLLSQGICELEMGIKSKNILGSKVFIGHGRAPAWKELRDFIQDRLKLEWDEFNRVPIAGIPNTTRLVEMLDQAQFAFLVLTAEDQQSDGKMNPRMNVVHEAGLFQGRLGFEKAVVLLEEGCDEFSNIHGLGQIRFSNGNLSARFEDIRSVLEREGVIKGAEG